jgi:hypothetical protein
MGLPRTQSGYGSLSVIIDQLTKIAHFIPIQTTHSELELVELCMSKILYLHGVHRRIVSARGTQFISKFWERLHETMDTHLNFSSA